MTPSPSQRLSRAALLAALAPLLVTSAQAGGVNGLTERISFNSSGNQVLQDCSNPQVSGDGRYIAYATVEALLPADTSGVEDVYVLDRVTNDLVCASTTPTGAFGTGASSAPAISNDGRWVVFETTSSDLVAGDFNFAADILLKDLQSGALGRISAAIGDPLAAAGASTEPAISEDGKFIAFQSSAVNLVGGDLNGAWDVFVRDLGANTMTRASVGFAGEGNGSSRRPSISADGRRVCFQSEAWNLVPGDGNFTSDVFVRDLGAGTTTLLSRAPGGAPGNGFSFWPSLSADGQRAVFMSDASDLAAGDANGSTDVFAVSLVSGKATLVSASTTGQSGNAASSQAVISADGTHAVFRSNASDLVLKNSPFADIYMRRLDTPQTWLISRRSGLGSLADQASHLPGVSRDGSVVAFESDATNLDSTDTNGVRDIYVRTVLEDPLVYCNSTPTSDGCLPQMDFVGIPSATAATGFELRAKNVSGNKTSMLFYGLAGGTAQPFLGGTLCVQGQRKRSVLIDSGSQPLVLGPCDGLLSFDMNAFARGTLGGNPSPALSIVGQQVNAQYWGRDPGAASFHTFLSDAVEYFVGP